MNDPRLQRSPPLIRVAKWFGLWATMAGIIYIHFNYRSPEYVNIRKPSYVAPDDRVDIVGYREELLESVSKYRDE